MTDFHASQLAHLKAHMDRREGSATPIFCERCGQVAATIYREQDAPPDGWLREVCVALGWQGGTIHQALAEIRRLRAMEHELATLTQAMRRAALARLP